MKHGAPISPSFTISSEKQCCNQHFEQSGCDDYSDKYCDDFEENDDDCILAAAANLCLSHLAFTADQRRKRDYI